MILLRQAWFIHQIVPLEEYQHTLVLRRATTTPSSFRIQPTTTWVQIMPFVLLTYTYTSYRQPSIAEERVIPHAFEE
jgi:hypothetical protein